MKSFHYLTFLQIHSIIKLIIMGLESLGPFTRFVKCSGKIPPRILLSSVRREYSSRNVVKTLDSRGMLEDVFPKEAVHKLGNEVVVNLSLI